MADPQSTDPHPSTPRRSLGRHDPRNRRHEIKDTENTMASLSQRLRAFLASPHGRRLVEQGQRQLARPENQRKLRQLLTKLQNRK